MRRKIGVVVESLGLGIKNGIIKAVELGIDGFQMYVTRGETAAENLSAEGRKDFLRFVADTGIEISALCGDMGKGFLNASIQEEVISRTKGFIDLAVDLETRIITTHIGHLPDDENSSEWEVGIRTAQVLARYAEERGCVLASETGPERPVLLRRFLERVGSRALMVNYDPANLIMAGPFDHIGGVEVLGDWIVHTHAKDGVCLLKGEQGTPNRRAEVPLGEGSVAFRYYLKALDDIGYEGYLTIERESGEDPVGDVDRAVRFLKSFP